MITYRRPYLYPKQLAAVFAPERYAWIEASTKSGKTHACICWLFEQALAGGPGHNYWWIAPIYRQAEIAYERLKRAIPPQLFTKQDQELSLTLVNGSKLWFKSGEKPDHLFGEDVYACVVDEATRVRWEAFVALRSTLTATRGPIRVIGNVVGKRNWCYRMCREAEAGKDGHAYARLTAYDAVDGGVLDRAEVEDARLVLPESAFRQLYLALPAEDGDAFFKTDAIRTVSSVPPGLRMARGWDFAASEPKPGRDPDWTAGVLVGHTEDHTYVLDVVRRRLAPDGVLSLVEERAVADGAVTRQVIEEERGAAGKNMLAVYKRHLARFPGAGKVVPSPTTGDKQVRAFGFATRVNGGKVSMLKGAWNADFLAELDEFPTVGVHDDQVDAVAHAYNDLAPNRGRAPRVHVTSR